MTWMVVDSTDNSWTYRLTGKPFGKFGPFDSESEAEEFINLSSHPESYWVLPTDECQ